MFERNSDSIRTPIVVTRNPPDQFLDTLKHHIGICIVETDLEVVLVQTPITDSLTKWD